MDIINQEILKYTVKFTAESDNEYTCFATIYEMKLATMANQFKLVLQCKLNGDEVYKTVAAMEHLPLAEKIAHKFVIEYDPELDPAADLISEHLI